MIYLAQKCDEDVRKGNNETYSLEEVMNDPAASKGVSKLLNSKSILL